MASIIKRKNSYCVVYRYTDEKGESHQRWESFPTNAEARKRKNQIEYEQDNNVFTVPEARTVRELLVDYMEIYGVNKWAMSTYDAKNSLINNYINPIIGDIPLSDLNPRMMEKFYLDLLKVKSKVTNNRKPDHEYLTPSRIREVHKLLRNAFNQAVKWELMTRNPVEHATIPKEKPKKRAMWDLPTFKKALELCDDDDLSLALNLAFSCTLRMGEMLGITLDCIDVSEDKIENGTASIFIEKELQRVKRDVFEKLNQRDVLFVFPRCLSGGNTVLVLKEPKTETSKRRVYLPKTVAKMVLQRIKDIQEIKELLGDEYHDYNLLFSSSTGRPMEGQIITRALKKLIRDHNLIDFILILKIYIKRYKQKAKSFVDNTTAYAFSNAFTISEQKRNYIVERSYDMDYQLNRDSIPYDVHKYIADICKEFENIISEITSIPKQYMSVSFVYRYIYQGADEDSTNWKWIIGKEHTTQMKLNDFINNPETAIYNLVNSKETYIFSNDKKALADKPKPQYYMSTRDYNHNKVGSIFLLKIMFSNNAQSFVESVLTISTYGRRFVENETKEYDSHILRNVIFEEVCPFYQKLLETELGVLYLRHISQ